MENKIIGEFNAQVWAKEFVKAVKRNPSIATDEGTMVGWFANAMMEVYRELLLKSLARDQCHQTTGNLIPSLVLNTEMAKDVINSNPIKPKIDKESEE